MGKTTITVQDETLERFKQLKSNATADDMPEQSADLFLQSLMDTWDGVEEGHYSDREETLQVISEQLENMDLKQTSLDEEHITETIKKRIDDLESQLPRKVAEEVHNR